MPEVRVLRSRGLSGRTGLITRICPPTGVPLRMRRCATCAAPLVTGATERAAKNPMLTTWCSTACFVAGEGPPFDYDGDNYEDGY